MKKEEKREEETVGHFTFRGVSDERVRNYPKRRLKERIAEVEEEKVLCETDRFLLEKYAGQIGWNMEDLRRDCSYDTVEELAEFRGKMFKKYYEEAKILFEKKDDLRNACEKIWGSITALIKLISTLKHISRSHWSRGDLDNVIYDNLSEEGQEGELRKTLKTLYDNGDTLHTFFYEGGLAYSEKRIKEKFEESQNLIKKARKQIKEIYNYDFRES